MTEDKGLISRVLGWFRSSPPETADAKGIYSYPTFDQMELAIAAAEGTEYTHSPSIYSRPTFRQMERLVTAITSLASASGGNARIGVSDGALSVATASGVSVYRSVDEVRYPVADLGTLSAGVNYVDDRTLTTLRLTAATTKIGMPERQSLGHSMAFGLRIVNTTTADAVVELNGINTKFVVRLRAGGQTLSEATTFAAGSESLLLLTEIGADSDGKPVFFIRRDDIEAPV